MKPKRIYYRRKGKSIIIEGKQDGKSLLIWTLPNPETLLSGIIAEASFFTREKRQNIIQKLERLDTRGYKEQKQSLEVPLIKINRPSEKDAKPEVTEEQRRALWELTE